MIDDLDIKILKTILTNNTHGIEFSYNLNAAVFTPELQVFVKLVLDYIKAFRVVPTRRTLIERHAGNTDRIAEINQIWDAVDEYSYNIQEYPYDLDRLKKRYQSTAIVQIKDRLDVIEGEIVDPDSVLKELALRLQQTTIVKDGRSYTQKVVGDYLEEFADRYEARRASPEDNPAVFTKYSLIDFVTGGILPAELVMIGGETNAGKSMMLSNLAINMWLQDNTINTAPENFVRGYNVLYFSLEMPYEDCFIRFLSRVANVSQRDLAAAKLSQEHGDRVRKANEFIKNYQKAGNFFGIVDVPRNATIEEIELRYNDALLIYRPDIVVVDYMGLMHNPAFAREQDWLRQGAIAASLHEFARAYDVIVLTAAQLTDIKRGSTSEKSEESKRVGVHRMGRSSMIMHHVNLGIQIESRPGEMGYPDLKYHIIKNRKGPLGQGNMIKNFAHAALIDVPYIDDGLSGGDNIDVQGLIKSVRDSDES
jgi:hypothetical protein